MGGKYQITPDTLLKADYYHVKGDGRFLLWTNSGYAIDDQNNMHSNEFDTVSLGITHQFTPQIRSTLAYGYMKAKDDNRFAELQRNSTTQNKRALAGLGECTFITHTNQLPWASNMCMANEKLLMDVTGLITASI